MSFINLNHIKETLSDKRNLGLHAFFTLMVIYAILTGGDHRKVKLFLLVIGLSLVILFVKKISHPILWYVFMALLINDLIFDYFVRANHHFFLMYLTAVFIIYLHNNRLEDFETNIKLLLAIVLFFSGLQKMLSPQFTSGDYYYYMINIGSFFKPLLYFSPEINDIMSSNRAEIAKLQISDPNSSQYITLQNVIPYQDIFSRVYAWVSIVSELVGAILILWKPKHIVTQCFFVMIILGIFFTRLESGFLATLAISGIWLTDSYKFRAIYTGLTVIFFALIITKLGFY